MTVLPEYHHDEYAIPIVRLWGHLLVPIVGDLSDLQAEMLSADVVASIERTGAASLLIDVSGVAGMDSHLCATLARLAATARLMGAQSVLSGLSPEIVITLQTMGVELKGIQSTRNLEDAFTLLGIGRLQDLQKEEPETSSASDQPAE